MKEDIQPYFDLKTLPSIDKVLSTHSKLIFKIEEDDSIDSLSHESIWILNALSEKGVSSLKQIEGHLEERFNRYKLRRKLYGKESATFSLLNRSFVIDKKNKYFHKRALYGLSFKGLLILLQINNFESIFPIKYFYKFILKWSDNNKKLADLAILFMKYNTALIILWHQINNVKLTNQKSEYHDLYFISWNITSSLVHADQLIPIHPEKQLQNLLEDIRNDFFVISYVIDVLLKKEENGELIRNYLKEWIPWMESLQFENIKKYDPEGDEYGPGIVEGSSVKEEQVIKNAQYILDQFELDKSSYPEHIPSILPYVNDLSSDKP